MKIRVRHFKYRTEDRLRNSRRFLGWAYEQSDRLSITFSELLTRLRNGNSFEAIEASVAPEPEPDNP